MSTEQLSFPQLKVKREHNNIEVYKVLNISSDFTLSSIRKADSWFMNRKREIVQMEYVTSNTTGIFVYGHAILNKSDFFKRPVSSSELNIFLSNGNIGPLSAYKICEISAKMLFLSVHQSSVFLPLLHILKN